MTPGSRLPTAPQEALLRSLFDAAIAAAQPALCLSAHLPPRPKGRTIVIGAGKASAAMARALEDHWDGPLEGLVVTRYGYEVPCQRIEIVAAAHPVPNTAGLLATQRIRTCVQSLSADDLVIALISGGGSSLLVAPAPGLTLADKQAINAALLRSGATISEMNCVRRHLSAVKGGRLAATCYPAQLVTLLISDVPGDRPMDIASGPTVPDPSTCVDALAIIHRYGIQISAVARAHLESGAAESVKPGDAALSGSQTRTIAAPCVLLSGGETTVTLKGSGRGGRNVELLLSLAVALDGLAGVSAIAGDTDGVDGAEEIAGAVISPDTLARAWALGINPRNSLDANDAHGFFQTLGDSVFTGPTLTNVNDFRAIHIEGPSA